MTDPLTVLRERRMAAGSIFTHGGTSVLKCFHCGSVGEVPAGEAQERWGHHVRRLCPYTREDT